MEENNKEHQEIQELLDQEWAKFNLWASNWDMSGILKEPLIRNVFNYAFLQGRILGAKDIFLKVMGKL